MCLWGFREEGWRVGGVEGGVGKLLLHLSGE